jgi:hypothetical protein
MITLRNGQKVEYHASYSFPEKVYNQFTSEQKDTMRRERKAYRESRNKRDGNSPNKRYMEEMRSELRRDMDELRSIVSAGVPSRVSARSRAEISQVTAGSMMGGRTEQANKRSKQDHSPSYERYRDDDEE